MNILLLYSDSDAFSDLCEMMQIFNVPVHAARSQAEAVSILVSRSIDAAIFTLRTLADLEFLKFLNTSYPQIKIFLFVENTLRHYQHFEGRPVPGGSGLMPVVGVETLAGGDYECAGTYC